MKTKHKCLLAALAATITVLSVIGSIRRSRQRSHEERFTDAFSLIVERLSGDSDYIVEADPSANWGFSVASDFGRLGGYAPDDPILNNRDLGPLRVTVAVIFEKKPTLLSRATSACGVKLSTGKWIYPHMLTKKEKTIMVAMTNPTMKEMKALAGKVNRLKIDSDISIAYHDVKH